MDFDPNVTIVIPVYNGANYLREAVDSALAQTYPNIEVIVVNDGSTDGGKSEQIALSYGDRIRYISKTNGGVASALNAGIRNMTGEYFSWLSHDDVYYPDKVAVQVQYLSDYDQQVVLYGDYDLIDRASKIIRRETIQHVEPDDFRYALITGNPIHGCTALVPKACFDDVGAFDERLKTTQDYDLWFRMAKNYDFIHLPGALIQSRVHAEQGTIALGTIHLMECTAYFIACLDDLERSGTALPGKSRAALYAEIAVNLKQRRFFEAANHALALSERYRSRHAGAIDLEYGLLKGQYAVLGWKQAIKDMTRQMRNLLRKDDATK